MVVVVGSWYPCDWSEYFRNCGHTTCHIHKRATRGFIEDDVETRKHPAKERLAPGDCPDDAGGQRGTAVMVV